MHRVAIVLAASLGVLLALQLPASAHGGGGGGGGATSYVTTIGGISPPLPGVTIRLVDEGHGLQLRNDGPEVVVLGYLGEPFVRVGPDGAFENRRSPTVAANREDAHADSPSGSGDPAAPPDWQRLSSRPVARWHDHRIHWEGADPPGVAARPRERQVVRPAWEVPLRRGTEAAAVWGQVSWVPGPSPAPWFALMAAACAAVLALGLLRRWGRPLAAAAGVLLGVDLLHAAGSAFASDGGLATHLGRIVSGSFYAVVGWVLAGIAVHLLRRGRVDGLYAGVFAGLSIAVFGGLLDVATLSSHTAPFALPLDVARGSIALSAGGGLGLAGACLLVIRRTPEARRVVGGHDGDDRDQGSAGPVVAGGTQPVGTDGT